MKNQTKYRSIFQKNSRLFVKPEQSKKSSFGFFGLTNKVNIIAIGLLVFITSVFFISLHQPTHNLFSEFLSENNSKNEIVSNSDPTASLSVSTLDESKKEKLLENYGQLPLYFEPNKGQIKNEEVKFSSRGQGYQMFLMPNGVTLALTQPIKDAYKRMSPKAGKIELSRQKTLDKEINKQTIVEMQMLGSNQTAKFSGSDELESKSNYFIGNDPESWRTDVANYKRVRFDEVYSGINLEYYGDHRQLEYDFIVEPNADPSQIKLKYKGINKVSVSDKGELLLKTPLGEIKQKKPFVYQKDENGEIKEISSSYIVKGKEISFQLAEYDKNKQLIIDPVVLVYSTFLGGTGFDTGVEIAVDNQSNAYIRGYTQSLNFPSSGALQSTYGGGNFDAFVCKFNATGNQFVYSTFLGGSGTEDGPGAFGSLTVDAVGNAYISGSTNSSNYPITSGSFQPTFQGGGTDGFITKLSPTGNQLVFSTYFGGNKLDYLRGIKVDANNNVYVAGFGDSTNMPVTAGAIQPNLRKIECRTPSANDFQCRDIYLAKLNASGSQPIYFTYFGSSAADFGNKIAIDNSGNLYVTGETTYTSTPPDLSRSDFPTTVGVVQPNFGGNSDAYLVKINSTATALIYSTFLGSSDTNGYEFGGDIAIDSSRNVYVTGGTTSASFPLANPYQANYGGGSFDVFVAKLNPTATAFVYSTYLGGSGYDNYPSMAVDNSGNAYITGETNSPNFPQVQSRQPVLGGTVDAFVTKLNNTGNQILYSTYHGGTNVDNATSITVDNNGNAYITGGTHSDQNFPLLNPRQSTAGGFFDAFVSKFLDPPTLSYNISGQITGNGTGAGGVIVNLNGGVAGRTTTDVNGFYSFNNLPSNSYLITPVLENASFDNTSRTVTISNSNPPPTNFSFIVCPVQLSSTGANVPSDGIFDGSFSVSMSGCQRNVTSNASWLIVTNGETGNGNGTISYTAQKNFGAARSGTIMINGRAFTVTQQANPNPSLLNSVSGICDTGISFSQSRIVVRPAGGTNNSFTANIPSSCGTWWVISNKQTWLRVTSPITGNVGTQQVRFTVDPNPLNEPRSGNITINGQVFTVIQTYNFPQEYSLEICRRPEGCPFRDTIFPVSGAPGDFEVNIAGNARWTTFVPNRSDAGWLKLPPAPGNSGIYTDTKAKFTVEENRTATQRTGTIVIGDQAYMVTQAGGQQSGCNYQLSSTSKTLDSVMGSTSSTGSFLVSVGNGCSWTATNTQPTWLEITGGSGNGNGTVSFRTIQTNTGNMPRSATIAIGGRTFNVTQNASQQTCSRTINPISQDVSGEGATGSVMVSSTAGCSAFTASSNVAWISSMINNSQINYVVQANNSTGVRSGVITVEGQTFTINQSPGNAQRKSKTYDFLGEDKSQISVYRPSNGVWYFLNSQLGFSGIQFGISTDKIVPADYDGDGRTDIAVYRPANGIWYILRSNLGFTAMQFGTAEDIPQPADFDGDGKADLGVYRPSNGVWYVFNLVNNQFTATQFGISSDKPVVGDYDGDGKADLAVYRPAPGIWYLLKSAQGFSATQFGLASDRPVVGDYDGDGLSDIAVYRPSNGVWYLLNSSTGFTGTQFGIATDLPVPGDYDGDGRTDLGVYRNGVWYLLNSTTGFRSFEFGLSTDKPTPNAFVPQP